MTAILLRVSLSLTLLGSSCQCDCALCPHSGTLVPMQKKEVLSNAAMWITLEDIMFHEISQSQKDAPNQVVFMVNSTKYLQKR